MARYILKGHKRVFPDNPRPNSLTNVWQAEYKEVPVLPPGGTIGQVLTKESNLDYDVHWTTLITSYLTGANNGLSLSGLIAQLGGTLIKNTTINGNTFNLVISDLGTFTVGSNNYNIVASSSFNLRTPNVLNTTATSGQILRLTNAASGAAEWSDETVYSSNYNVVINPTSPYTVVTTKEIVSVDTTSGNKLINLKTSPTAGEIVTVKKTDNSVNTVTITPGVGHTIDNAAGAILTLHNQSITMVFDGISSWIVTSRYL